jgi:hypothetical protein
MDTVLKISTALLLLFYIIAGSGPMKHIVILINSLQLIIHLPIMMILFPANCQIFFYGLVKFVCFDIFSDFGIYEMIMNFDEDT